MSGPYRHIGAATTDDILVLTVEEEQVKDSIVAQQMRFELVHALGSRKSDRVVLDMRNLTFMTSLACVAFIAVKQSMKGEGERVALCNMSDFIKKIFHAKRLLRRSPNSGNVAFESADTLQDAIEMLKRDPAPRSGDTDAAES